MSSLVEAKNMYLRKLVQILSPEIYSGFKTMYKDVERFCKQNTLKEVIAYFQKELEKIPKWSRDRITEETMKIQSKTDCDYLLDIITTLLMVNMKILLDSNTTLDLEVPQLYTFIHKCYMLIGAELWSNPELMGNSGSSSERQRNYSFVMKLIHQGINDAIQFYLPMRPILNRYLRSNQPSQEDDHISLSSSSSSNKDSDDEIGDVELTVDDNEAPSVSSMVVHVDHEDDEEETGEVDSTFFADASDIV
jgi:hypothetical protein